MTDDERISDDERRGQEALGSLRGTAVDPAFRARLRRDFAAGTIAGATARPAIVALPRRRAFQPWLWPVAAAAAGVVFVTLMALNPEAPWRVVSATGSGVAMIGNRPIPMDDVAQLAAAIVPGARVRVPPGCGLEIASTGTLAIQMLPGTDAIVPRVPGRWFARVVEGTVSAGEWRITTGREFRGAMLAVVTPQAHVEVTGTTLAVIADPPGTCVCVFEGHVRVGRDAGSMATVMQGRRRFIYADASKPPLEDAMLPRERPALGDFCEAMKPLVQRPHD